MFARFVSSAALPAVAVVILAVGLSFAGQSAPTSTEQVGLASVQGQVSSTPAAQQDCCPDCCPDCPECPDCCAGACRDSTAAQKSSVTKAAQSCPGSSCCAK
jgi:hypothetical protein